ncbi:histidine ammonia-lyase [soil metagenome]
MSQKFITINGKDLTIETSVKIVTENYSIKVAKSCIPKIKASRRLIDKWINQNEAVYGITTGFGEFKDVRISTENIDKLQRNLILSHAAGVGKYIPDNIARLMMLFRINSLIQGYSGVRLELIEFLVEYFNNGLIPLIPSQGSVGSSGDLSPLAHMSLSFIGEGYTKCDGEILESSVALRRCSIEPIILKAKEGLALINGTQMMTAYMCWSLYEASRMSKLADVSGALSLDALRGSVAPFDKKIHNARPHKGQADTAKNLLSLLKGSEINTSHSDCGKVQDAYSLRCMPQVHGAVKDTINYCRNIIETEMNSVTDNPLIFSEQGVQIPGGNFHGEPVAFAADFLAIAVSELGSICERRIARILDGSLSGLPRFLVKEGGLNSGLMIAQYTAAALASENKSLSHPASVDSIPTSANQEDHNSMGSIGSRQAFDVINNVKKIIAIEFLCACQGLDFLEPLKTGKGTGTAYELFRGQIAFINNDVNVSNLINSSLAVIFTPTFLEKVERSSGKLIC